MRNALDKVNFSPKSMNKCYQCYNVTYPRLGPFGAKIGKTIPTNPQNAVIKITGSTAISI